MGMKGLKACYQVHLSCFWQEVLSVPVVMVKSIKCFLYGLSPCVLDRLSSLLMQVQGSFLQVHFWFHFGFQIVWPITLVLGMKQGVSVHYFPQNISQLHFIKWSFFYIYTFRLLSGLFLFFLIYLPVIHVIWANQEHSAGLSNMNK